ncbi:hypothetical protein [Paenarthrobacter sp. Z7-10]|nr:hypothetical protein [Paenarthrobacter sp. Z7-10]
MLFLERFAAILTDGFGAWIIYSLLAAGLLIVVGALGRAFARS